MLALPTPRSELAKMADASPRLTASSHPVEVHLPITLPLPEPNKPQYVQVEFPQPYTASTLEISQHDPQGICNMMTRVEISNDGTSSLRSAISASFTVRRSCSSRKVSARYYRVLFTAANESHNAVVDVLELHNRYRIADIENKTAVAIAFVPSDTAAAEVPAEFAVPKDRMVDLTDADEQGRPARLGCPGGPWTVLRFGHTITGVTNAPAPASGCGLECDKLSKDAIEAQFAGMMDKLVAIARSSRGEENRPGRHAHRQLGERLAELDGRMRRNSKSGAVTTCYLSCPS